MTILQKAGKRRIDQQTVVSPEDLEDCLRHRATDMHSVRMLETHSPDILSLSLSLPPYLPSSLLSFPPMYTLSNRARLRETREPSSQGNE